MKNITMLAAMAVTLGASAQRAVGTVQYMHAPALNFSADRTPTDTLVPPAISAPGATFQLMNAQGGGYVVGSNAYGDLAKVQVFANSGDVFVEELLIWFGGKSGGTATSVVHARVYPLDAEGLIADDVTVMNAPGTALGNVDLLMSDCDTAGSFTVAAFTTPVSVSGNFGAGVDFSDLPAAAYIGMVHSANGGPGSVANNTWEKWDDGTWGTMSYSWPLTFDIFILAVIDDGTVGINDLGTVNNMRMSFIGSNPATNNVTVAYEMLKDADARLTVMDGKGAKVVDQQLGRTAQGQHQTSLDVSNLANGTYYVTLFANGNPLTKKLVVQH